MHIGSRIEAGAVGSSLWESVGIVANSFAIGGGGTGYSTETPYGISSEPVRVSPLVRFTALAVKRRDISTEEFHRYWLFQHAPLTRKFRHITRPLRYVQSHVIPSPTLEAFAKGRNWTPNPYDGVVELWWHTDEEMAAALTSPEAYEALALLAEDERRFCDSSTVVFMTREYEIFTSPEMQIG